MKREGQAASTVKSFQFLNTQVEETHQEKYLHLMCTFSILKLFVQILSFGKFPLIQ